MPQTLDINERELAVLELLANLTLDFTTVEKSAKNAIFKVSSLIIVEKKCQNHLNNHLYDLKQQSNQMRQPPFLVQYYFQKF